MYSTTGARAALMADAGAAYNTTGSGGIHSTTDAARMTRQVLA